MKIILENCNTEPFSSYMKALGIFKILSYQLDNDITARFEDNKFTIYTNYNKDQIIDFFLNDYIPAVILSPWNRENGFLLSHKQQYIDTLQNSSDIRFKQYKAEISRIKNIDIFSGNNLKFMDIIDYLQIQSLKEKILEKQKEKIESSLDSLKNELNNKNISYNDVVKNHYDNLVIMKSFSVFQDLQWKNIGPNLILECRSRLSDEEIEWLDATVIIDSKLKKTIAPLMGTGGNEGNLDYSTTFIKDILNMLTKNAGDSIELLKNALFGDNTKKLIDSNIGKFNPGRAGGYNQGNGIENKKFYLNPWEFILLMEGLLLWSVSVGKRFGSRSNHLMSPFTFDTSPVGYSSSSYSDYKDSFEVWLPVWTNQIYIDELKMLLNEGKLVYNNKIASNGLQAMEAIKSLGADRGIDQFFRYVSLRRRGESGSVLVPVNGFKVEYNNYIDLMKDLNPILANIKRYVGKKETPEAYRRAFRVIEENAYNMVIKSNVYTAQSVLISLGKFERLMDNNIGKFKRSMDNNTDGNFNPININYSWFKKTNDGSPEFLIAASIASICDYRIGGIRKYIEPVVLKGNKWAWNKEANNYYQWSGNNIYEKLANVLYRILLDAQRDELKDIPLNGKIITTIEDVSMFIDGLLDNTKIENLIFGLSLLNWNDIKDINDPLKYSKGSRYIKRKDYEILKILFSSNTKGGIIETGIIPLLKSGRVKDAMDRAEKRILIDYQKNINASFYDTTSGLNIAGALIIPVMEDSYMKKIKSSKIMEELK